MKKLLIFLYLLITLFFLPADEADLEAWYNEVKDEINVFYSTTCSYCHDLMDYLKLIEANNPGLVINYYETKDPGNENNNELMLYFCSEYETGTRGVPRMFINGRAYVGFSKGDCTAEYNDTYKAYVACESLVEQEIANWFENRGLDFKYLESGELPDLLPVFIFAGLFILYGLSFPVFRKKFKDKDKFRLWLSGFIILLIILVFLLVFMTPDTVISRVSTNLPFPLFVFLIALADGFNPCAFAALFILLSLLTHAEKKRDMNIIGSIFIIISALMYFIFIVIMITAGSFFFESYGNIILRILGGVVLVVGLINIKDFVLFKKGITLSISDDQKKDISIKAAGILKYLKSGSAVGFISAVIATVLLGISVNIIELGCSAILPAVYVAALINMFGTQIGPAHILWTINYSIIYILPMVAILLWFIFTYKSARLTESKGRLLKLIGGIIMVTGGAVLLINPDLLFLL